MQGPVKDFWVSELRHSDDLSSAGLTLTLWGSSLSDLILGCLNAHGQYSSASSAEINQFIDTVGESARADISSTRKLRLPPTPAPGDA